MNNNNVDYFSILDGAHTKSVQELEFANNEYIYLAHITTRESEIIDQAKIMCSSGCLVGSVYCIPVFKNKKEEFYMHNLGKYIFQNEVSFFSENNFEPKILLFEIKNPKNIKPKLIGLNYLNLGNFHFNIFEELKFLLHEDERKDINIIVLQMLNDSKELIKLTDEYKEEKLIKNFENFYKLLINTIKKVPIFGYFLFEINSEYIANNQTDIQSKKYAEIGEIYVGNFKEMTFKTVPYLTKNFDLGQFTPDMNLLVDYIQKLGLNYEDYKRFLIKSISSYTKLYLFNGILDKIFFTENLEYEEYTQICPHFVGHILHRIIRKMNRYPDFHINFDTYKAIKIWNYWNKNEILIPVNSIMLKGEVGINPVVPNLEYKLFKTKILKNDNDDLLFEKDIEVAVKISPQLVELSKLMMRKKYEDRK